MIDIYYMIGRCHCFTYINLILNYLHDKLHSHFINKKLNPRELQWSQRGQWKCQTSSILPPGQCTEPLCYSLYKNKTQVCLEGYLPCTTCKQIREGEVLFRGKYKIHKTNDFFTIKLVIKWGNLLILDVYYKTY